MPAAADLRVPVRVDARDWMTLLESVSGDYHYSEWFPSPLARRYTPQEVAHHVYGVPRPRYALSVDVEAFARGIERADASVRAFTAIANAPARAWRPWWWWLGAGILAGAAVAAGHARYMGGMAGW